MNFKFLFFSKICTNGCYIMDSATYLMRAVCTKKKPEIRERKPKIKVSDLNESI